MDEVVPNRERVGLINQQIGGIAIVRREGETARLDEALEAARRSDADIVTRAAQTEAKRDIRNHIAACAAGEEGEGFHGKIITTLPPICFSVYTDRCSSSYQDRGC